MAVETRTFWGGSSFPPNRWGEVQSVKPLSRIIQPDRRATESKITEVLDGVRKFPRGIKGDLRRAGLPKERSLFTLTGQSIMDLRKEGFNLESIWHKMHPDIESQGSKRSRVIVDPKQLFMPATTDSYERKMEEARRFYGGLKGQIRNSETAELEFADLLKILFELRSRQIVPEGNVIFMTASTAFGGKSRILVGARDGLEKISIRAWPNKATNDMLPALGLVPR